MIDGFDPYWFAIFVSLMVIISFMFNLIARKTNIPTVLLLIGTGIGISEGSNYFGFNIQSVINLKPILETLGILGLIMIVLEAALDLKLERGKWPIIWKSFTLALILLLITSLIVAYIIHQFLYIPLDIALLYAVPLSIMSSAIIIPSVGSLYHEKKEFMIYEATFSDVLGIILFYLLIDMLDSGNVQKVAIQSIGKISLTVVLSVLFTYAIVFLFQRILKQVNYFMIFAILLLLYAVGKKFHLSSLIIILVFGLIINNKHLFFRGFFSKVIDPMTYEGILENFKIFTGQTSFLVRTFFFIVFGMSITLSSLANIQIYGIVFLILLALYITRFINLSLLLRTSIFPELFIAPRGLITILLFFSIPEEYLVEYFEKDIIFLVIIVTNIIMMLALMIKTGKITDIESYSEKVQTDMPPSEPSEE